MMKTGIIVVLDTYDKTISKENFTKLFQKSKNTVFCFVNNNCKEERLTDILMDIAEEHKHVHVINIKKNMDNTMAIRAGVRYISIHCRLKLLGYVTQLKSKELINSLDAFIDNHDKIINLYEEDQKRKKMRQSFLQSLLSVKVYLNKINYSCIRIV